MITAGMTIGQAGIDMIKRWEGFHAQAYLDPIGIPTIGFGTIRVNGRPVKMGMTCTMQQAEMWLMEEVNVSIVPHLHRLLKVPVNQKIFDSLCSFIYNLGIGNFSKSTMLRMLNAGDYRGAADQFPRWNRAGGKVWNGLTKRRMAERELFLAGLAELSIAY
jgi:GH24 family phage-related lysozyme (muramidase)